MSSYYLDTSALVKCYVSEVGSDWLRTMVAPAQSPMLLTSRMAIVEVVSAFARRVREGSLAPEEFAAARDAFRGDCLNEYQIMPPTVGVIELACTLLERRPLRAYDAIHLATALSAQEFLAEKEYSTLIFLSADDCLNRSATAEGLVVDNPNRHP